MPGERLPKLFIDQNKDHTDLTAHVREQGFAVDVWVRWGGGQLDSRPPLLQLEDPLRHVIGDTAIRAFVSPAAEPGPEFIGPQIDAA